MYLRNFLRVFCEKLIYKIELDTSRHNENISVYDIILRFYGHVKILLCISVNTCTRFVRYSTL